MPLMRTGAGTNKRVASGSRYLVATALVVALAALSGCPRQSDQKSFIVLTGTLIGIDSKAGELRVKPERGPGGREPRELVCVVTKDSEVYLNNRFSAVSAAVVGDTVELGGRRAADERVVVNFINITRAEPEPPPPRLEAASQPAP